jgi:FdhD protein
MKAPSSNGTLHTTDESMLQTTVERVTGQISHRVRDSLAVEEPLEIQLTYGPSNARQTRSISVTMRTPGNDFDLAAGFLMTEGVIRDANDVERITYAGDSFNGGTQSPQAMDMLKLGSKQNTVQVDLAADVEVNVGSLQRNFYTTSSCGICGKASLLALRTVCPPRAANNFKVDAQLLYRLPERLRASQGVFDRTGGLHGAGLFD